MLANLLDCAYFAAAIACSPWLAYRRWVLRKPLAGLRQKLSGAICRRDINRPCVWFHAVSVGEVLQLQSLIPQFAARFPGYEVVISTTTGTGFDVAQQKFSEHRVVYWPLDFSWSVRRALRAVQPALVVLVELEVWPNFLLAADRRQIPVVVINGRVSAKSWGGYRRLRSLLRPIFGRLSGVAAQAREYAERFQDLGVAPERVRVTGNIKYDGVTSNRQQPRTAALREFFGLATDDLVWIAGSTQEPEERLAIEAYRALKPEFPRLRLLLVPRHKERFAPVAALIEELGFPVCCRSQPAEHARPDSVLLLDTLGELGACWGLADIAFVGGSLTQRGGQNMLEPAAYGAAVCFGPNTSNFREIVESLLSREAAVVVHDGDSLRETIRQLAANEFERHRLGEAAQSFVLTQQGATAATLDLLGQHLPNRALRRVA